MVGRAAIISFGPYVCGEGISVYPPVLTLLPTLSIQYHWYMWLYGVGSMYICLRYDIKRRSYAAEESTYPEAGRSVGSVGISAGGDPLAVDR